MLLLVACRVGVLVRCLRGDRAWALNLAVVSDACQFLRCLRTYTATRSGLSESSLVLILELDSSAEATETSTATNEEEETKKKVLAIAKQLGAKSGGDTQEPEHGAVLYHSDNGIEAWGIRVEGLVLILHGSSTKLHPLPVCRITCHPRTETTSLVEAPMVLLPSKSPYQPAPTLSQDPDINDGVRLVLGRSIKSVVDIGGNSSTRDPMQFGVGVPVFPDDDSNEGP
ncbi:hypothetical protein KRP22_000444 [Phytophthora ramorum]|nr:hypothetical protein KRP22_12390 [Phytophthora ramorum]